MGSAHALVAAALQHAAESAFGARAVVGHVHDVLQHQVIEQEAAQRPVHAAGEVLAEPVAVEPPYPGLAAVDAVEEAHFAGVGKERHRLVVQALVDVVAVFVLQALDGMAVLEARDLARELCDAALERRERIRIGHRFPLGLRRLF